MEIITAFPDGDTWQRDSCNPFSQVMKVEAFRQCVLNPPNIANHYPISAFVHVRVLVLGYVFPAERSWQTGSSAAWRSEEAQVLKWFWLQSATAEMPGIRHKLNRTVENWQRMEKRHKIGDLKKYWCFDENNDAFFAHEGQGLYHVCFIVYLFFSSLVAVVMTPGSRDAWLYVCERNVCWNSGT